MNLRLQSACILSSRSTKAADHFAVSCWTEPDLQTQSVSEEGLVVQSRVGALKCSNVQYMALLYTIMLVEHMITNLIRMYFSLVIGQ